MILRTKRRIRWKWVVDFILQRLYVWYQLDGLQSRSGRKEKSMGDFYRVSNLCCPPLVSLFRGWAWKARYKNKAYVISVTNVTRQRNHWEIVSFSASITSLCYRFSCLKSFCTIRNNSASNAICLPILLRTYLRPTFRFPPWLCPLPRN
jgi:hypothetical protein